MHSQYDDHLFKGARATIFENARLLRKLSTDTEDLLWQELRNRKVAGLKFRRQHPLGPFVADFYCNEKHLVIEVDGGVHETETVRKNDEARTAELNNMGIQVLRFTNDEVQKNIASVLDRIVHFVDNQC